MFTIICLAIITAVLAYEILRLQSRVMRLEQDRILGEPADTEIPDDRIEAYLASTAAQAPRPAVRVLHVVSSDTRLIDDEDPLALYSDTGIVVSTH